jgi:hypothetical protein
MNKLLIFCVLISSSFTAHALASGCSPSEIDEALSRAHDIMPGASYCSPCGAGEICIVKDESGVVHVADNRFSAAGVMMASGGVLGGINAMEQGPGPGPVSPPRDGFY